MAREASFDDLVVDLNASGWLISDLWQSSPVHWACALRQRDDFTTAYSQADSPARALRKAMDNRRGRTNWDKVRAEQEAQVKQKASKRVPLKQKVKRVRLK